MPIKVRPLRKRKPVDTKHHQYVADCFAAFWWKWNTLSPDMLEYNRVRISIEHALAECPKPIQTPTQKRLNGATTNG